MFLVGHCSPSGLRTLLQHQVQHHQFHHRYSHNHQPHRNHQHFSAGITIRNSSSICSAVAVSNAHQLGDCNTKAFGDKVATIAATTAHHHQIMAITVLVNLVLVCRVFVGQAEVPPAALLPQHFGRRVLHEEFEPPSVALIIRTSPGP